MVGKGDRIEAFLHVEDMCRAAIHAWETDAMVGEAYNVSDDTRITTAEFFQFLCREIVNEEKEFLHVPLKLLLPVAGASQFIAKRLGRKPPLEKATLNYLSFDRIWDNSKLKATGFAFRYPTMEEGMKETLAWYRKKGFFK